MKGINKVLAVFFALITVFLSVIVILYVGDVIGINDINKVLDTFVSTRESKLITMVVSGIIAIIGIVFVVVTDTSDYKKGTSLTLPLTTGNISISAQTFESMVLNVTKKYNNLRNVKAKVDIREDGLYIDLYVYVLEGTVVADIMCKLQQDIKTTILKQTTVEVKVVEVKIKGIYNLNENKLQD